MSATAKKITACLVFIQWISLGLAAMFSRPFSDGQAILYGVFSIEGMLFPATIGAWGICKLIDDCL